MRVACFDSLPVGTLMWTGAQPMLTVIVKVAFDLLPNGRAVRADVQRPLSEDGPPGAAVLHECCDHVPYKPASDLLIVGHAKAPAPALQIPIRVACPPQFEHRIVARASQPSRYVPLAPLYLRSAAGESVQVGPNALAHDARRAPDLGHNFDYARFNVAPPAQQLAQIEPGMTIELEGLLGQGKAQRIVMPDLVPLVFRVVNESWEPLRMVCDTVWIDVDAALLTMTWRAVCASTGASEAAHLVLSSSHGVPARPADAVAAEMKSRLRAASWIETYPMPRTQRHHASGVEELFDEDMRTRKIRPVQTVTEDETADVEDTGPPTPRAGMQLGGVLGETGAVLGAVTLTGNLESKYATPFDNPGGAPAPPPEPVRPLTPLLNKGTLYLPEGEALAGDLPFTQGAWAPPQPIGAAQEPAGRLREPTLDMAAVATQLAGAQQTQPNIAGPDFIRRPEPRPSAPVAPAPIGQTPVMAHPLVVPPSPIVAHAPLAAPPPIVEQTASDAPKPKPPAGKPLLAIATYAAIRAAALDGESIDEALLASHDLDDVRWRAAARRWKVALATDDGSLKTKLSEAIARVRRAAAQSEPVQPDPAQSDPPSPNPESPKDE